jgi:hypothetical protein
MSLSFSTRRELRSERERLARQLAALDALLAEDDGPDFKASSSQAVSTPATSNGDSLAGVGLREGIRRVLAENPGLTPKELTSALSSRGFQHTAKTPFGTRVGNEIWRMRKRGGLRVNRGKYFVPQEQQSSA